MNILLLAAYPPVLHMHGGGVRMYHNIRLLGERHRVRVISFVENDDELRLLRSLSGICESIVGVRRIPDFRPHWLSLKPFLVREFSTPGMDQAIDDAIAGQTPDLIQYEYLQMAQYRRRRIPSVLTIHETLSANAYDAFRTAPDPATKFKLYYRWMQMLRYEVLTTRRFDRVVTMTEHDAGYLRSYSPGAKITAIPIGIDPGEFDPLPEEPSRPLEVLFVGNFRHTPNVEAAEFLIRDVAPFFPNLRFVLPGSHVPAHLQGSPNVEFPGYAPDTRILYHRPNTIVAAPLFSGTGQRVKLLEAFSMGCPVITTSVGGLGFSLKPGVQALIANSAAEFRAALNTLSDSIQFRRELGQRGREMILQHFDWTQIGVQMRDLVDNVAVVSFGQDA